MVSRRRGEEHLLSLVLDNEAVRDIHTLVAVGAVVVYGRDRTALLVIEAIGISPLEARPHRGDVVYRPAASPLPYHTHTSASAVSSVAVAAVVCVVEEAVGAGIESSDRDAEIVRHAPVIRSLGPNRITRAVLGRGSHATVPQRRESVDVQLAPDGITAVERTLRAAQNLDARDVEKIEIVAVLIEVRYLVDIDPHDRLVDAGAEAAHIYRRGHTRTVVGLVEVRNHGREILHREHPLALDGRRAQYR